MVAEVLSRLGAKRAPRADETALLRASLSLEPDEAGRLALPALLQAAGAQSGVDVWRLQLCADDVVGVVRRNGPIATLLPERRGFAVIEGATFGRVKVTSLGSGGERTTSRMSASGLADMLGLSSAKATGEWLSCRSRMPLDDLATKRGAMRSVTPLKRIWYLSLLELRDLRSALVYAVGISLLSLAVPLTVQMLISQALAGVLWQPAIILTVILTLTLGFRAFLQACETLLIESVSRRIFVRVARDFVARIVTLGPRRGQGLSPRLAAHRIFDGAKIEKGIAAIAYDGFAGILTIIATVTLLTIYHPLFALAAFLVIVFAIAIVMIPARRAIRFAIYESKAKHALAVEIDHLGVRPDLFAGLPAGDFAKAEIEYLLGKWTSARHAHFRVYFKQFLGFVIVQVFASAMLLVIGAWLIFIGELTVGQLVAGELMMTAALVGVSRFATLLPKLYDVLAAIDKVGEVLDLPKRAEGGLTLPGAPVSLYLGNGVAGNSVEIPAGARLLMAGEPDALEAVCRGLNEGGAHLHIDGRAASSYRMSALGERVCWVDEPFTVPGTLLTNLRIVAPTLRESEAADILAAVGFDINAMPLGVLTEVRADGDGLSRAERVRLTLARAIVSRPAVLAIDGILDRLSRAERHRIIELISGPTESCPWTLLVVSADPEVAGLLNGAVAAQANGAFAWTSPARGGA